MGAVSENHVCLAPHRRLGGAGRRKRQDSDDFENQKGNSEKLVNGPKFRAYVCAVVGGGAPLVCVEGGAHEMAILAKRVRTLGRGGWPAERGVTTVNELAPATLV
jgi:hypothetical protein